MIQKRRRIASIYIASLLLLFMAKNTLAQVQSDRVAAFIEQSMIWSVYDVGSSGYNEASSMADAMMKQYGTRIRLMPSGTSIGRLLPLKTQRVKYAFLATETYFASEGLYEFSSPDWGPQDLRVLFGRPASVGFATAANANIKTLADLRGKRVAYVEASPTTNVKVEAFLALANLTEADVITVRMPSYSAALRGLVENTVDAAIAAPTASILYELEASPRGIVWPAVEITSPQALARVNNVLPIFGPMIETIGAGISNEAPIALAAYRYPMVTVYANLSDEEAYNMIKAFVSIYPLYKDASPLMARWDLAQSGHPPIDVPFHPGAIRYLKEVGIWTLDDDQWNAQRLARLEKAQQAWTQARLEAQTAGINDAAWPEFWMQYRATHLHE